MSQYHNDGCISLVSLSPTSGLMESCNFLCFHDCEGEQTVFYMDCFCLLLFPLAVTLETILSWLHCQQSLTFIYSKVSVTTHCTEAQRMRKKKETWKKQNKTKNQDDLKQLHREKQQHTHTHTCTHTECRPSCEPCRRSLGTAVRWDGGLEVQRWACYCKVAFFSPRPAGKIYVGKLSEKGFSALLTSSVEVPLSKIPNSTLLMGKRRVADRSRRRLYRAAKVSLCVIVWV